MTVEDGKRGADNLPAAPGKILTNALVFRGHSAEIYQLAVNEVRSLLSSNLPLYPPQLNSEEDRKGRLANSTITISTVIDETGLSGPISPTEAVAIAVLQHEAIGLGQVRKDPENHPKIKKVMGLDSAEDLRLAIEGFNDFSFLIGLEAGYRQRILAADRGEKGDTVDENDDFVKAIRLDGMVLGKNITAIIIKEIGKQAYLKNYLATKIKGARLAAALYLEVLALASKEFSVVLEKYEPINSISLTKKLK
ncbi:MAG: hypothetical protein M1365_09240 [Actinobacteria bacterium]|nr:hypothetical protein [Actinomycetota bacterium]